MTRKYLESFDRNRRRIGILVDADDIQRTRRVNSDYSLSFTVPMTSADYLDKIVLKGHVRDERGQFYVINNRSRVRDGRKLTARIDCSHVLFKLADYKYPYASYIDEAYGVHISQLTTAISAATGGKYTFSIDDTFPLFDVKDFGRGNALEALNAVVSMYGAEIEPDNYVIHLRKKIGRDVGLQYRIRKNIVSSTFNDDTNTLVTRMFAQMKDGRTLIGQPASILTADERALLESVPGAIVGGNLAVNYLISPYAAYWATDVNAFYDGEIIEQNITSYTELLEAQRKALREQEVPALEITVSAADIHKLDSAEPAPGLGDTVKCVDPALGMDGITARITELIEYPYTNDKHSQVTITNVMLRDMTDIIADLEKSKNIVSNLISNGTIRTDAFEAFAKAAVNDVHNSKTEVKYDSRGIVLQDKTDARNQVIMTSNGIIFSKDGGVTAMTAINANGIAAPAIVGQLGNFVSLLIGAGNNVTQINTNGIAAGHAVFNSAPFRVDMQGNVTANRLTANSANIFSSNFTNGAIVGSSINVGSGKFTVDTAGNMYAEGSTTVGGTITGSLIRTAASGRRVEINASGFRSYDAAGRVRIQIATTDDSTAAALIFRDTNGTAVGEINTYQSSGQLTMFGNDIFIGSNNTGNPIRLQGAVILAGPAEFRSTVSGLNLGIGNITGLRSELDSIWNSLSNKSSVGHTHTVSVPNHNHGNPDNQTSGGGTFTTSAA
ncbi:phage tail protein [Paenibacillus xylanexedens]|uniref:phage tail protein n=1 Tax=Paenibacillus xylanexedens TaxID=528191 RepID=UPI0011AA4DE5|nr:phage tail protein [Paenibacillus xylanexedens]